MSSLPANANLNQLRNQARDYLQAHQRGESSACAVLRHHTRFAEMSDTAILDANVSLQVVQHALARQSGLEDWASLQDELRFHTGVRWYRKHAADAQALVNAYREVMQPP